MGRKKEIDGNDLMAICIVHKGEFDADEEPGANLYSPPYHGKPKNPIWQVDKQHICRECYPILMTWIRAQETS